MASVYTVDNYILYFPGKFQLRWAKLLPFGNDNNSFVVYVYSYRLGTVSFTYESQSFWFFVWNKIVDTENIKTM